MGMHARRQQVTRGESQIDLDDVDQLRLLFLADTGIREQILMAEGRGLDVALWNPERRPRLPFKLK